MLLPCNLHFKAPTMHEFTLNPRGTQPPTHHIMDPHHRSRRMAAAVEAGVINNPIPLNSK